MRGNLILCLIILSLFQFSFLKKAKPNDSLKENVDKIKNAISNNPDMKYKAFNHVAYFVDTYGSRLLGSESLKLASDYLEKLLIDSGFVNVRQEEVPNIPIWSRGKESLTLYSPRPVPTNIPLVGLGGTVAGDIHAEVIVVKDYNDLKSKQDQVKGKIVLYNDLWTSYNAGVKFRISGAIEAAKYGAVGILIRSVASKSIENPHTGLMRYDNKITKIPAAAISLEDADMFQRMQDRGQKIEVHLHLEGKFENKNGISHNVIGELKGSTYPDEIILMGGHIDSWDVGPQTGANDDAAGFFVCFEAVRTLIKLGIRPKRTIRFIAWTGEEWGGYGSDQYEKAHINEMDKHIVAFESDMGTTHLLGFDMTSSPEAYNIVKSLTDAYLPQYQMLNKDGGMPDIDILNEEHNVPIIRNIVQDSSTSDYYFTYHHSAGDSVSVLNKDDLDSNVTGIATLFYLIADIDTPLPKATTPSHRKPRRFEK